MSCGQSDCPGGRRGFQRSQPQRSSGFYNGSVQLCYLHSLECEKNGKTDTRTHIKRQLLNNYIQLLHELTIKSTNFYSHVATTATTRTCLRGSFTGYITQLNTYMPTLLRVLTHLCPCGLDSTCFFQTCRLYKGSLHPNHNTSRFSVFISWYVATQIVLVLLAQSFRYLFYHACFHPSTTKAKGMCCSKQWKITFEKLAFLKAVISYGGGGQGGYVTEIWTVPFCCAAVKIQMREDKNVDTISWVTFNYFHLLSAVRRTRSSLSGNQRGRPAGTTQGWHNIHHSCLFSGLKK